MVLPQDGTAAGPTGMTQAGTGTPTHEPQPGAWGTFPVTAPVPAVSGDTGVVPAFRPTAAHPRRRSTQPPLVLRVLVAVLLLLVMAGTGVLVLNHYRPGWLSGLASRGSAPPTTAAPRTSRANTSPAHPKTSSAGRFSVVSVGSSSASLDVGPGPYSVEVASVNGESWVQATEPGQPSPLFAGIIANGQSQTFSADSTLTVQVGSVASHLTIEIAKKVVGTYVPPAAPFTVIFNGSATPARPANNSTTTAAAGPG